MLLNNSTKQINEEQEVIYCEECGVEGTWNDGGENGNFFGCEICGENICFVCLHEKGVFEDGVFCSSCIEETGLNSDEYKEVTRRYGMKQYELYNYLKNGEVVLFNSPEECIIWLYDTTEAIKSLLVTNMKKSINTGTKTLAEEIIDNDNRIVRLKKTGKVVFMY